MTGSRNDTRGRSPRCELLALDAPLRRGGGSDRVVAASEYTRCTNDATTRCRIEPDAGESVVVWLCDRHEAEYRGQIVETVESA